MLRGIVIGLLVLVGGFLGLLLAAGYGVFGEVDSLGTIQGDARPAHVQQSTEAAVTSAAGKIGVASPRQVLFGDFHVHTTY